MTLPRSSRPRSRLVVSALASALVCSSACTAPSSPAPALESIGQVASAVEGGQPDGLHRSALAICESGVPGECTYKCTGTLIAPNLVLTARHCLALPSNRSIDCATARFSKPEPKEYLLTTNQEISNAKGSWFRSREIVVPLDIPFCGADIGLIILDRNVVPADAVPVTPLLTSMLGANGFHPSSLTAIGFGATSPSDTSFGSRRIRSEVPVLCFPNDPRVDCTSYVPLVAPTAEFLSGAGVCNGDSGLSAWDLSQPDKPVTFGVLSRGVAHAGSCAYGMFTLTSAWSSLIAKAGRRAAELGRYEVPAWATTADVQLGRKLGSACFGSEDCDSNVCATRDDGKTWVCSEPCQSGDRCASGFECSRVEPRLCFPSPASAEPPPDDSCAVTTTPARGRAVPFVGLGIVLTSLGALAFRRRSRSRAPRRH